MYFRDPIIRVELIPTDGSDPVTADALTDTGSEVTLFDEIVAARLEIDLSTAPAVPISGVGGETREAKLAEVEMRLLSLSELVYRGEIAFAPNIESAFGNLLALDVLNFFDFGLSHANRIGYLGVSTRL
jgi:hypothetical protein